MKLEYQVCSLELSKQLKTLGVKQESLFYYSKPYAIHDYCVFIEIQSYSLKHETDSPPISAFTVAELGSLLPNYFLSFGYYGEWTCKELDHEKTIKIKPETFADTEADCRAKMLIYLIEHGIVKC